MTSPSPAPSPALPPETTVAQLAELLTAARVTDVHVRFYRGVWTITARRDTGVAWPLWPSASAQGPDLVAAFSEILTSLEGKETAL